MLYLLGREFITFRSAVLVFVWAQAAVEGCDYFRERPAPGFVTRAPSERSALVPSEESKDQGSITPPRQT